jgi:hypothetical protein
MAQGAPYQAQNNTIGFGLVIWMAADFMRITVSLRAALTVIAAEALFILCAGWVYAGMPGARADTGAPSITIRFETPVAPTPPTSRAA